MIYNVNLEIMKWIFGISDSIAFNLDCKNELMFRHRVSMGLAMFDKLTTLILNNQINTKNEDPNATVKAIVD